MAGRNICSVTGCGKFVHGHGYCDNHYRRYLRCGDPIGGRVDNGALLNFIETVVISHASDDCLIWPYGRSDNGYGTLRVGGKKWYAHRYVCFLRHGHPPTTGLDAAHSCGNGQLGCVNPGHLRWATRAENVADAIEHGTFRGTGYR